jgi:hypothetical protein
LRHFLQRFSIARNQRNVSALFGKREGRGAADTCAGSGNDGDTGEARRASHDSLRKAVLIVAVRAH